MDQHILRSLFLSTGLVLSGLLLGACSDTSAGPKAYGWAGPPGGAAPLLGFQLTTERPDTLTPDRTEVWTHGTSFSAGAPYIDPAGISPRSGAGASNLLPTVERNMRDVFGRIMPNTLPSTAKDPYALHEHSSDPGEDEFGVLATPVDPTSPTRDLERIFRIARDRALNEGVIDQGLIQVGLNILEGIDLLDGLSPTQITEVDSRLELLDGTGAVSRAYEGFPLLHYRNGAASKTRSLVRNSEGVWQATIEQVWYDNHIESDAAFLDVANALNEPWIVEYQVHVLDGGHDDFSPFVMYLNRGVDSVELAAPNNLLPSDLAAHPRAPHVAMDTTFYPMEEGNTYRIRLRFAPSKYFNLIYTWGWRWHPPRVQATENAAKSLPGPTIDDPATASFVRNADGSLALTTRTLPDWERFVFGAPDAAGYDRRAAIDAAIGDLAPAKRMWRALLDAQTEVDPGEVVQRMEEAEAARLDWADRTRLPAGVSVDPDSDLTLIYLNNTLYGEWADGRTVQRWFEYQTRSGNEDSADPDSFQIRQDSTIHITLLNGDRYVHGYLNVDFGGARGWENTFGSTIGSGGSGAWFSFGRVNWWINAGGGPQIEPGTGVQTAKAPIFVRPVEVDAMGNEGALGAHELTLHFNYDPSRRLRMYQFDPLHHDVAVFSLH